MVAGRRKAAEEPAEFPRPKPGGQAFKTEEKWAPPLPSITDTLSTNQPCPPTHDPWGHPSHNWTGCPLSHQHSTTRYPRNPPPLHSGQLAARVCVHLPGAHHPPPARGGGYRRGGWGSKGRGPPPPKNWEGLGFSLHSPTQVDTCPIRASARVQDPACQVRHRAARLLSERRRVTEPENLGLVAWAFGCTHKTMLKLVYVAGPYSAPEGTVEEEKRKHVMRNIIVAEEWGIRIARLGGFPVVPHSNTANKRYEEVQPYTFWVEGTLELLKRCDALFALPNWSESNGAIGEVDWAGKNSMPTFFSLPALKEWLRASELTDTLKATTADLLDGHTYSNVLQAAIDRIKAANDGQASTVFHANCLCGHNRHDMRGKCQVTGCPCIVFTQAR